MTTIDCGMSPCLYRRRLEQGTEWQPSNAWRFNFLDRLSLPTLVSAMLQDFGFIAQCMGSIIGTMAADGKNDWPLSPCYACRLVSPSGRLHNDDGSSNGSDFATFGTDETAKLPETHTCGWHPDGERHCFTNKLQMTVTVWTSKAQRRTAWRVLNELKGSDGDGWILMDTSLAVAVRSAERSNVFGDYSRVFVVGDCNCGCVETPVKKPDDWAIPPIPIVERGDSTILPQEQLIRSEQASFEFTCTSVEEAILWDCSIDFATASKMPERLRSPHLTQRATCAGKKQHERRRVSCERDATETTTCSFRGEVSATFTAICGDGSSVIRDESCLLCGAKAFANNREWTSGSTRST